MKALPPEPTQKNGSCVSHNFEQLDQNSSDVKKKSDRGIYVKKCNTDAAYVNSRSFISYTTSEYGSPTAKKRGFQEFDSITNSNCNKACNLPDSIVTIPRDDSLQNTLEAQHSTKQNRARFSEAKQITTASSNICYCSKDNPKSNCKLPDIFTPEIFDRSSIRHVADQMLSPDNLKRIGIEIEESGLQLINTTPLVKGQILARTFSECFGYPVLSVTAEMGDDEKAVIELVTAPLTIAQLNNYDMYVKLTILRYYFAKAWDNNQITFGDIISLYNDYIEGESHEGESHNESKLIISTANEALPYKGQLNIKREVECISNHQDFMNTKFKRASGRNEMTWHLQHNFFMPFLNLIALSSPLFYIDESENKLDHCCYEEQQKLLLHIGVQKNTEIIYTQLQKYLDGFEGNNDIIKKQRDAFLSHHAYIAYTYYDRLREMPYCKNHLNSIRYSGISVRTSPHQEMLEIFDDELVKYFVRNAHRNGNNEISKYIIGEIQRILPDIPDSNMKSIYDKWLSGYWQDFFECARLRVTYGKQKVISANTAQPFIGSGNTRTLLPLNAEKATIPITDIINQYTFITEPQMFNDQAWVVVELRANYAHEKGFFPFNNSNWMVKKTASEEHFLQMLWGDASE